MIYQDIISTIIHAIDFLKSLSFNIQLSFCLVFIDTTISINQNYLGGFGEASF